jgi:hypothetical protein
MSRQPVCFWCGELLTYRSGEGWVHHAGSVMMMRCDACGARAAILPTPIVCPTCGRGDQWNLDHTALPRTDSTERPAIHPVPLRGQGAGE